MAVVNVAPRRYILAYFIRSDDERLLLGDGAYEFTDKQQHFAANTVENDVIEVQGNDGALLAGQVRRAATQSFDGYVGDGTTTAEEVEKYRRAFLSFFRKNYLYTVVYVFADGSAIQRKRGYIVDAPEITELYQIYPEYHVALNFEDVNYYAYSENADGSEAYGKSATVGLSNVRAGGLMWGTTGAVFDEIGAVFEEGGSGGPTIVAVDSIDNVYPVLTVRGPANNPILTNNTTNETLTYIGNITSTQTLVIDMMQHIATLNGTSVIQRVSGDYVSLAPGNNRITYATENADAPMAVLEWQEVVG